MRKREIEGQEAEEGYDGLRVVNATIFPSNHARQISGDGGLQREALWQRSSVGI